MKKVSVIMGIYNCEATLPDAIESILKQTYTNWELIMCDDGSSDNTYAVAKKYADQYPEKIILIKNPQNMYLSYTLNHCLQHATGFYVARMDADDMSLPNRFEIQVDFLENHPEYQLVGSVMQLFDEKGDRYVQMRPEKPDKYTLRYGTPFSHPTVMTYKYVFDKLGGYTVSERTRFGQDYDLWFRFYAEGFIGYNIQTPLYRFREDLGTIKRRTFKSRVDNYRTIRFGFKLLGYPKRWYIKPLFAVLKGLVPARMVLLYQKFKKG